MLEIASLRFKYNGTSVLDGLSMEVRDGELVGIVGPNGAGKTTLLRLISGVAAPTGGRVLVDGTNVGDLKAVERARLVAVVPQNPDLPLSFTLEQLVLMGRNPHLKLLEWEGLRDLQIVRQAMERTDTLHLAGRRISTLSGGERQRGLMAMALAQQAPVLLLDEPTSSLDLSHQTAMMDLVRDVQESNGGAVVVVMHDLTLAAQYCGRIVMISRGRAHAVGTPDEVLTSANIKEVYGTDVEVLRHPTAGTPVVLPVSRLAMESAGGIGAGTAGSRSG